MRQVIAGSGVLFLGKQGENEATVVRFPIAEKWKELYGDGVFQLLFKRPSETQAYACVVDVDGEYVDWVITNTEVLIVGQGRAELCYFVNNTLAKSETWITVSVATLADVGETPPEPWESWVEEVLQAGSDAEQAATDAVQAKTDAESARDDAVLAKNGAVQAKDDAEDFAQESEAWAVGTKDGVPVEPTDEQYENNAKHYAELAEASVAAGQYFGFYIDDNGELYVVKTPESDNLNFQIDEDTGELEVVFL